MRLSELATREGIFIDANIFCYALTAHPKHGEACRDFLDYIEILKLSGLRIIDVKHNLYFQAVELGSRFGLHIRDAIHSATCEKYGVPVIATRDSHFEKVPFLRVYKPD